LSLSRGLALRGPYQPTVLDCSGSTRRSSAPTLQGRSSCGTRPHSASTAGAGRRGRAPDHRDHGGTGGRRSRGADHGDRALDRQLGGEFWVTRHDGSRFLAHVRDAVVLDDDGRPLGLIGISIDLAPRLSDPGAARPARAAPR